MSRFSLEHFYFGHTLIEGQPGAKVGVVAVSKGITTEIAKQAVERVRLPPAPQAKGSAWALVRGKTRELPFMLVQTLQGIAGDTLSHYIVLPPEVVRALAGNVHNIQRFLTQESFPSFTEKGGVLKTIDLIDPPTLSNDAQVNHILDLMTYTRNNVGTIEKLLSAIVQGIPLYVQYAPESIEQRVTFLQGLLALLPGSARYGVTFALHAPSALELDVQIRFTGDNIAPPGVMTFDWPSAKLGGHDAQDDYSHFVVSQLRLDAELVIQRNTAMAAIAGWRLNQGDNLAQSLGYASTRIKIDSALNNNQPVNKEEVAKILVEDPTLSPDLQVKYALHLLRLGLAMRDLTPAAPVAILLRGNDKLEKAVLTELNNVLDDESSRFIYSTLIKWMNNPLGPQGFRWVDISHRATLTHLQKLIYSGDSTGTAGILKELHEAGITLQIDDLAPKVIKLVLPLSYQDAQIAEHLFLLGVRYLPNTDFQELMSVERFRAKLNPQLAKTWVFISGEGADDITGKTLLRVAREYGERWEANILVRFCEVAQRTSRYNLLDASVFRALYGVANSSEGREYTAQLRLIARAVETNALETLPQPGPRYLLQIYLALGDYETLAKGMLRQLKQLPWEREEAYLLMVRELFTETQVPLSRLSAMLDELGAAGVRSAPHVVAMVSAVQPHRGAVEVEPIVRRAVEELERNRNLADLLPAKTIFSLLDHYTLRRDIDGMRTVMNIIPAAIREKGGGGVKLAAQVYRKSGWSAEAQAVGLDVLRAAVRLQNDENALKAIGFFVKQFGKGIQRPLEVTYLVHRIMGQYDLDDYAEMLHDVIAFLHKLVSMYVDENNRPGASALQEGLGTLPGAGGVRAKEREKFLENILYDGRCIIRLARQYRAGRTTGEAAHAKQVVSGRVNPASMIDFVRVMSGGLVEGRRLTLQIKPAATRYPFQDFSMAEVMNGFAKLRVILHPLVTTLPLNKRPDLNARVIITEMQSFAGMMGVDETLREIARDWQYLADLLILLDETSDAKAFGDGGLAKKLDTNKQAPVGALELMRFIYGYYLHVL